MIIGYAIFIWGQLPCTWAPTPDTLYSAWMYLLYFLFLRIQMNNKNKVMFVYLGMVLGLAFLTKPFANIFIIFFLVFIFFIHNDFKQSLIHAGITLLALLLLIGPYILALSNYKGYFTLGETIKVNYLVRVNKIKGLTHWQGECNSKTTNCHKIGKPKHPTKKTISNPNTYRFDGVFKNATLPTWYDPSYWYEGATPYFNFKNHFRAFKNYKVRTKALFTAPNEGLFILISFLVFLYSGKRIKLYLINLSNYLYLFIPTAFIITIIAFCYNTPRYTGPFLPIFWLSLFSAIRLPALNNKDLAKKVKIATFLVLIVLLINGFTMLEYIYNNQKPYYPHKEVAQHLKKIGITKGDKVARLESTLKVDWARLAKVKIIAEVDSSLPKDHRKAKQSKFWKATKDKQTKILRAFKTAGAIVAVSQAAPESATEQRWERINETKFYIYDLRK
ncbi:MAG: hypothetical protein HYZ79_06485 [Candidatus Melainabacteria bacterium]|nr:hypothetical protein [Candidatus Melainabacteria bacterium]